MFHVKKKFLITITLLSSIVFVLKICFHFNNISPQSYIYFQNKKYIIDHPFQQCPLKHIPIYKIQNNNSVPAYH